MTNVCFFIIYWVHMCFGLMTKTHMYPVYIIIWTEYEQTAKTNCDKCTVVTINTLILKLVGNVKCK